MAIESYISAGIFWYIALPLLLLFASKHIFYACLLAIIAGIFFPLSMPRKKVYFISLVSGIMYSLYFFVFHYQQWVVNYINNSFIPSKLISPLIDLLIISITVGIFVALVVLFSILLGRWINKSLMKSSRKK